MPPNPKTNPNPNPNPNRETGSRAINPKKIVPKPKTNPTVPLIHGHINLIKFIELNKFDNI